MKYDETLARGAFSAGHSLVWCAFYASWLRCFLDFYAIWRVFQLACAVASCWVKNHPYNGQTLNSPF